MKRNTKEIVKLMICGSVSGLVNGFFGSGGGIIAVEAMEKLGIEEKEAHATSIFIIAPLCAVSAFVYFEKGGFKFDGNTLLLIAGAAAGGAAGSMLLGRIGKKTVDLIFTALMVISGIWMLL